MDVAQTVARAMEILEVLGQNKKMTGPNLIQMLGFHRSTAYRLINTLQQLGYMRKDEDTGLYSLTPKLLRLSAAVNEQQDITTVAKPHLLALHEETQETIHMALLEDNELLYLEKMESTKNLRVVMGSKKGSHAPLYCTGIGKALLAWKNENDVAIYLSSTELKSYTEYTLTSEEEISQEMKKIRNQGYSLDKQEHELGVFCVAVPIRDFFDNVIAAISVSIPYARLDEKMKEKLISDVMNTGANISKALSQ